MAKFRKKPVVIRAFQMTEERRWDNSEWPEWLNYAWNLEKYEKGALYPTSSSPQPHHKDTLSIMTLEGQHLVGWNDWIIQGVQGELYPCKPDIFEMTYEPA